MPPSRNPARISRSLPKNFFARTRLEFISGRKRIQVDYSEGQIVFRGLRGSTLSERRGFCPKREQPDCLFGVRRQSKRRGALVWSNRRQVESGVLSLATVSKLRRYRRPIENTV